MELYRKFKMYAGIVLRAMTGSNQRVFTAHHQSNIWGSGESVSGTGSEARSTVKLRRELRNLLDELGAKSLLDSPCGDFNWMSEVDLSGVNYLGMDVVKNLTDALQVKHGRPGRSFVHGDICSDPLLKSDVILCRDCLVHLSNRKIKQAISNFKKSGSQWLLTTTFWNQNANTDIYTGMWRPINLLLPPFSLPAPEKMLLDDDEIPGKGLGLWRLKDLP